MRLIASATLLAAVVAAGMSVAPARACGCGIALQASVTRERALVIQKAGREEIIASFDLRSDDNGRAAVVLPVPGDPTVEAIESGDPLSYLDLEPRRGRWPPRVETTTPPVRRRAAWT